jgi:NAD(P)-dependent dehydrogenase (short-subunit alcohol dehydrogenase family)
MAKEPRALSGKVVAITGGGRGIGRATAEALARRGAKVAIGDVDAAAAEAAAAQIGYGVVGLHVDVTDRPGFTAFLDEAEARLGPLDVMVNNAGIMPVTRFEDESEASITRQIEINLHGVIHGTREAARRMRPRHTGHIVNIASAAGKSGFAGLATYCATKHGVVGYSEAVRAELRDTGIEISVVMPVIVNTELTTGLAETRGVKKLEVAEVVDTIVGALERPYFDVFVPKSLAALQSIMAPLPRRGKDAMARLFKSHDAILAALERPERRAYEERAAASAPAAEAVVEAAGEHEKAPA